MLIQCKKQWCINNDLIFFQWLLAIWDWLSDDWFSRNSLVSRAYYSGRDLIIWSPCRILSSLVQSLTQLITLFISNQSKALILSLYISLPCCMGSDSIQPSSQYCGKSCWLINLKKNKRVWAADEHNTSWKWRAFKSFL